MQLSKYEGILRAYDATRGVSEAAGAAGMGLREGEEGG